MLFTMFGLRDKEGSGVFLILLRMSEQGETCGKNISIATCFSPLPLPRGAGRYWAKFLQPCRGRLSEQLA